MCSRLSCPMKHDDVRKACSYLHGGKYVQPPWLDTGDIYEPSYNLLAHDALPVLVSGHLVDSDLPRVLMPMTWGMIPSWHSGVSPRLQHRLTTTVCRAEGVNVSRFCGKPFHRGRRCVITCTGFYEWQKVKKDKKTLKQAYFLYMEQPNEMDILDKGPWTWNPKSGWFGPRLLHLAGVFDTWVSAMDEVFFSFTVLTLEADPSLSWLGNRQPAVLETDAQVASWLDSKNVSGVDAVAALKPTSSLRWHAVSNHVNSWKNKDHLCSWPVKLDSEKEGSVSSGRKKGATSKRSPAELENGDVTEKKKASGKRPATKTSQLENGDVAESATAAKTKKKKT